MKKSVVTMLALVLVAAMAVPAAAQHLAKVQGKVTGFDGQPLAGAKVTYTAPETGRKYEFATNNKGEWNSIGVTPGEYNIALFVNGNQVINYNKVPVRLSVEINFFEINLQSERAKQGEQLSPEEKARREAAQKEAQKVKGLNEMLSLAQQSLDAGNYEAAISTMEQAAAADPTRDLIWFKLADAQRIAGTKTADKEQKAQLLSGSIENYKKAIAIKPTGAYYNNMADSYARLNNGKEALAAYQQAANTEPANAGQYWFNAGAVLTNANQFDDANAAFDKAIAADPTRVDAYYLKGTNLIAKATIKDGKMVAPAGTEEAFNKYLEAAPDGKYAEQAKAMLQALGAEVATSYKKSGTKKK